MTIKQKNINEISKLLNENKIKKYKLISNSFNINCLKVYLENQKQYIVKYYSKKNKKFNAIKCELKNLIYLHKKNLSFLLLIQPLYYIFFDVFLLDPF